MIEAFLSDTYKRADLARLSKIENNGFTNGKMDPRTRVVVNIPAHYGERRLEQTLAHYASQDAMSSGIPFEVNVLINGPRGVMLINSRAAEDALEAINYHNLRLNIFLANYSEGLLKIGQLRKDLAAISLRRAARTQGADINNLIIVTNDADLMGMPEDYISHIARTFESNPSLMGWTGFVDYPESALSANHIFLTMERYNDTHEAIVRRRDKYFMMKEANSAFRAKGYMEAGGYKKTRLSENRPLFQALKSKDPRSVKFDRKGKIVTSPRRQLAAIEVGVPQAQRYVTFGLDTDLGLFSRVPEDELVLPEDSTKVTSDEFIPQLERELQEFYNSRVRSVYRTTVKQDLELDRLVAQNSQALYLRLVDKDPQKALREQEIMRLAAVFTGFKIAFGPSGKVSVLDIDCLRKGAIEKYSFGY